MKPHTRNTDNKHGELNELALFAGAGGGILGSHLLGWNTICAVERDAYAAQVLAQRQNDRILKPFPIWSDVTTFDGRPWKGIVDVVSGGFPCQDISSAGTGEGLNGSRSGLWFEMARIIGEVRPKFVFVENSPLLVSRGLSTVISDLAKMGYDAQWARISASNLGAPHQRDRIWIVAHSKSIRFNTNGLPIGKKTEKPIFSINSENMAYATSIGLSRSRESWFSSDPAEDSKGQADRTFYERFGHIWGIKSRMGRVANGVAYRVDRLKAVGNGQVPGVAKCAFNSLS
ncbi:MAG: DNA cytosine methyltransferase [Acinetobacter sp.]|nr:DNA cytosine methyltransferase [Acinetobacter sp.]